MQHYVSQCEKYTRLMALYQIARNPLKFPNEKYPRVFVYTIALRVEKGACCCCCDETRETDEALLLRVAAALFPPCRLSNQRPGANEKQQSTPPPPLLSPPREKQQTPSLTIAKIENYLSLLVDYYLTRESQKVHVDVQHGGKSVTPPLFSLVSFLQDIWHTH